MAIVTNFPNKSKNDASEIIISDELAESLGINNDNPTVDDAFNKMDENIKNSGSKANSVSVTLNTSWTEQADGTFAQTVSVTGVTGEDSQAIVVDIDLDGTDIDADIAVMEAWGCVNRCDPGSGTLKFVCYGDTPTVAIPLNVVVM